MTKNLFNIQIGLFALLAILVAHCCILGVDIYKKQIKTIEAQERVLK